jgi:hypothetical protein
MFTSCDLLVEQCLSQPLASNKRHTQSRIEFSARSKNGIFFRNSWQMGSPPPLPPDDEGRSPLASVSTRVFFLPFVTRLYLFLTSYDRSEPISSL